MKIEFQTVEDFTRFRIALVREEREQIALLVEENRRLRAVNDTRPSVPANPEHVRELLEGMQTKNKIQAIKAVRAVCEMGLKEAKDIVDQFWPVST